jgi:hypothetical protein
MKILNDLERLFQECDETFMEDKLDPGQPGLFYVGNTAYGNVVRDALPALICVVRAAAELEYDSHYNGTFEQYIVRIRTMNALQEALQQLRFLGAAELVAHQERLGLDD